MKKQSNQFNYQDIVDLGFKQTKVNDSVYFQQYGYGYSIFDMQLTPTIYLDWEQSDRHVQLIRVDNLTDCNIKSRYDVKDLDELNTIINFFKDK